MFCFQPVITSFAQSYIKLLFNAKLFLANVEPSKTSNLLVGGLSSQTALLV